MFADLASGPRASGMVSQGRVANLIGAKPEERRGVLEEAAGIAGLRARRHEAELKLRQAEGTSPAARTFWGSSVSSRRGCASRRGRPSVIATFPDLCARRRATGLPSWSPGPRRRSRRRAGRLPAGRRALALAGSAADEARRLAEAAHAAIEAPRAEEGVARTLLERRRVEAENLAAEADRAQAALAEAESALTQLLADLEDARAVEADARTAETRAQREAAGLASAEAQIPARIEAAEAEARSLDGELSGAETRTETATEAAAALAARANQIAAELAFADQRHRRVQDQLAQLVVQRAAAEAQALPESALEAADAKPARCRGGAGGRPCGIRIRRAPPRRGRQPRHCRPRCRPRRRNRARRRRARTDRCRPAPAIRPPARGGRAARRPPRARCRGAPRAPCRR